jgi:hypothetical protein
VRNHGLDELTVDAKTRQLLLSIWRIQHLLWAAAEDGRADARVTQMALASDHA